MAQDHLAGNALLPPINYVVPFPKDSGFARQLQLYVCECLQHPLLPLDHSRKHISPRHLAPLHMQASFYGDDASVEIQDE